MKPYIANFLTPIIKNSDELKLQTHETRSLEDTHPDDTIIRGVTVETSSVESTEPDDLIFNKQTFSREETEPDELYLQQKPITESLEDTVPDDNYHF